MRKKYFYHFIFCVLIAAHAHAAYEIALTFDDLPTQEGGSAARQTETNAMILSALKECHAPAVGFVNEGKVYHNGEAQKKVEILRSWIKEGHVLGNHTYSHPFFSRIPEHAFFQDIEKGSLISANLMRAAGKPYQYFRLPYLDSGHTKEKRRNLKAFLDKKGYISAPVTVDTHDWKFNRELKNHPDHKAQIIAQYLEHTKSTLHACTKVSEKALRRNIKHIWLLHCNQINAYAIKDLLKIAQDLGYKFITLEDALKDPFYQEPSHRMAFYKGMEKSSLEDHTAIH